MIGDVMLSGEEIMFEKKIITDLWDQVGFFCINFEAFSFF